MDKIENPHAVCQAIFGSDTDIVMALSAQLGALVRLHSASLEQHAPQGIQLFGIELVPSDLVRQHAFAALYPRVNLRFGDFGETPCIDPLCAFEPEGCPNHA